MNKKVLGLTLTSLLAVTTLASCNKDDGKIHISFWYSFGKAAEEPLLDQIKKFEEVYPEYKVDVEPKGGYDNLKKAVSLGIPTGKFPDVTIGYPDHVAEYLSAGIVVPLDDFMNSTDPEIGIGEGAKNAKNDFLPNYMVENRQYDEKGTTYGLPFNKSTELMYYNKTVFDHFNIKVPETWTEFEQEGKKLQTEIMKIVNSTDKKAKKITTKDGHTLDFSTIDGKKNQVRSFTYDSASNAFITLIRDFGGTYTEVDKATGKGYLAFNEGESLTKTKEAMQMLKDMSYINKEIQGSFAVPAFWQERYASNLFVKLQTFATIGSSAGAKHNLPTDNLFEVGVAPIPYNDKIDDGKNVIQQGTNIMMLDAHEDEDIRTGAWKLVRFLTAYQDEETGYDPNAEFAIGASYLPVRTSGINSIAYQEFLKGGNNETPADEIKRLSAETANKYDDTWNKFVDPAFVGSSSVREKCGEIIPTFTTGNKSVEEAMKIAVDQLLPYVKPAK